MAGCQTRRLLNLPEEPGSLPAALSLYLEPYTSQPAVHVTDVCIYSLWLGRRKKPTSRYSRTCNASFPSDTPQRQSKWYNSIAQMIIISEAYKLVSSQPSISTAPFALSPHLQSVTCSALQACPDLLRPAFGKLRLYCALVKHLQIVHEQTRLSLRSGSLFQRIFEHDFSIPNIILNSGPQSLLNHFSLPHPPRPSTAPYLLSVAASFRAKWVTI